MKINFDKSPDGLVPAVVQDKKTGVVLLIGFMDEKSLEATVSTSVVTLHSNSKRKNTKSTGKNIAELTVTDIKTDCLGGAILIKARENGKVCHKGKDTCFSEKNQMPGYLRSLERFVKNKRDNPAKSSRTSRLLEKGVNQIAKKLGEEAVELVIESIEQDDKLFKAEAADLLYHFMVMLVVKDIPLDDVITALKKRRK